MDHASIAYFVKFARNDRDWPVMEYINPVYTDWFNIESPDYVGSHDYDVWPDDIAVVFRLMDFEALASPGKLIQHVEPTPGGVQEYCLSRKIAVKVRGGLAILGWVTPYDVVRQIEC